MICMVDTENLTVLPSPEELLNKIIIKAKKVLPQFDSVSSTTAQCEALSDELNCSNGTRIDEPDCSKGKNQDVLLSRPSKWNVLFTEHQEVKNSESTNAEDRQEAENGDVTQDHQEAENGYISQDHQETENGDVTLDHQEAENGDVTQEQLDPDTNSVDLPYQQAETQELTVIKYALLFRSRMHNLFLLQATSCQIYEFFLYGEYMRSSQIPGLSAQCLKR